MVWPSPGALRVGAEFLSRFLPPSYKGASVYVADPTYVNHLPIFKLNGFEIKRYRYYDPNTKGLNYKGFIDDLLVRLNLTYTSLLENEPEACFSVYHDRRRRLQDPSSFFMRVLTILLA